MAAVVPVAAAEPSGLAVSWTPWGSWRADKGDSDRKPTRVALYRWEHQVALEAMGGPYALPCLVAAVMGL